MSKCPGCKVDYPDELLNRMFVSSGYTPPICGVCALEVSNIVAGGPSRQSFQGEMAEEYRRQALVHRRKTKQKPKFSLESALVGKP